MRGQETAGFYVLGDLGFESSIPMRGQETFFKRSHVRNDLVIHPHEGSGARGSGGAGQQRQGSSIPMRGQETFFDLNNNVRIKSSIPMRGQECN